MSKARATAEPVVIERSRTNPSAERPNIQEKRYAHEHDDESSNENETYKQEKKTTREEIQELRHALELQTATQAGVDATQVATTAGAQTTQAAAHAGTWSTMVGSGAGFVVGIFVALAFVATTR